MAEREVRSRVVPLVADMRRFLGERKKDHVIRVARNNYIARFLRPSYVLAAIDTMDVAPDAKPLTADRWLKETGGGPPRRADLPATLDLWAYANDWDSDRKESEHIVYVLDAAGKRHRLGGLAPVGRSGNAVNKCFILRGAPTRLFANGKAVALITNPAGNWYASRLYGFYLMPPMKDIDDDRATALIEQRPDWVRRHAAGFFEFPVRGVLSGDGAEEKLVIPLVGLPRQPIAPPEVVMPSPIKPTAERTDDGAAALENATARLVVGAGKQLALGPLLSYSTTQSPMLRLTLGGAGEKRFTSRRIPAVLEMVTGRDGAPVGATLSSAEGALRCRAGDARKGFTVRATPGDGEASVALLIETPRALCDRVLFAKADGSVGEETKMLDQGGRIEVGGNWFALHNRKPTDEGVLYLLDAPGAVLEVQKTKRGAASFQTRVVLPNRRGATVRIIVFRGVKGYSRFIDR